MKKHGYFISSKRLGFRTWNRDDFRHAKKLWGNPEVMKYIDVRGTLSEEQILRKLLDEIEREAKHGIQYWPMFLLQTGEFVGCCGLRPQREENVIEIGFHICSEHWRRGYAREAAERIIRYAFESLGARKLFAGHNPANVPSKFLLENIGFQYTHDEYYAPTGLMHPSYALHAEDLRK